MQSPPLSRVSRETIDEGREDSADWSIVPGTQTPSMFVGTAPRPSRPPGNCALTCCAVTARCGMAHRRRYRLRHRVSLAQGSVP
jgi:hypothetical protein